tara:strand:+ start:514 stop:849 length:336 start_codon:yes stop_codon:yes gene_type:complete
MSQPTYQELLEKFQKQKEKGKKAYQKYYKKKYKFRDDMTDDERAVVQNNKDIQYKKYREDYDLRRDYHLNRFRLMRERKKEKLRELVKEPLLIQTAMDKCKLSICYGALNQ